MVHPIKLNYCYETEFKNLRPEFRKPVDTFH